jgi:alpha-amylase
MTSVCLYFQVHQPERLRRASFFSPLKGYDYFDDVRNKVIVQQISERCYQPTNELLLKLCKELGSSFRFSFSLTGIFLEQLEKFCPETLEGFQRLVDTGNVEILAETYHHSLASLYDSAEFQDQVELHSRLIQRLFGVHPQVFRNTELIFSDDIARIVAQLGFKAALAEGCDDILCGASPNFVYEAVSSPLSLLLKNYRLSDDIAFRFSNRNWVGFPVTVEKFVRWVCNSGAGQDTVNIFLDYETFGEHQRAETGIFEFLAHFPEVLLAEQSCGFATPSEVVSACKAKKKLSFNRVTSWADQERDASAWTGNAIQQSALRQIYELSGTIRWQQDHTLLDVWRKLQVSDHFYYMCTKSSHDGVVHGYFNPFDGPYEAFINYMNVLRDFRESLIERTGLLKIQAA